jgi:hypothetical protein
MIDSPHGVVASNRRAVSAFVEAVRAVAPARWAVPRAPGKWSPSQVTEHVVLTYEQSRRMLEGTFVGPAQPWFKQLLARRFGLPRLFKRGDFGTGPLQGPDFIQPSDAPPSSALLLERLNLAARDLEQHLAGGSGAKPTMVVHPIFGRLPLTDLLHFLWIHTDHHRPQLDAGAA